MGTPVSRLKRLSTWLDERTAVNDLRRSALDEPIRGGARWAYVFGSTLAFLFALQQRTSDFSEKPPTSEFTEYILKGRWNVSDVQGKAIKDYAEEDFRTYDKKIRDDVTFLMDNLMKRYRYAEHGAKAICIYVIDNDLARKFTNP